MFCCAFLTILLTWTLPGSSMKNPYALVRMFPYNHDLDNLIEMNKLLPRTPISRTGAECCEAPSCCLQWMRSHKLTCLTELPPVSTAHPELGFAPCVPRWASQKTAGRVRGVGGVSERRKGHRHLCVLNIPPTQTLLWGRLPFLVSNLKATIQK